MQWLSEGQKLEQFSTSQARSKKMDVLEKSNQAEECDEIWKVSRSAYDLQIGEFCRKGAIKIFAHQTMSIF